MTISVSSNPRLRALSLSASLALAAVCSARAQAPAGPDPPRRGAHSQQQATDAYLAGARLLDRGDLAAAEKSFLKATELDPDNHDYATALTVAREHRLTALVQQAGAARLRGDNDAADRLLAQARTLDPDNAVITQHLASGRLVPAFVPEIAGASAPWSPDAPVFAGPIQLNPASGSRSFHARADAHSVLQQVYSGYKLRVVLDDSVPSQQLRFDLDDASYEQAVPILLRMTQAFAVPLSPDKVLIARDTPENRQRFERQVEETIYIPSSTPEQMQELGNLLRSVFDIKAATVATTSGNLVVRAPAETLHALNLTLADLLDGSAQVMLDLRLYSVDKTRTRNIGPQLPQQFGVYNVASAAQSLVSSNQALVNQAIAQGLIPANSSNIQIAMYLLASGLVQSSLLSNTLGFFGNGLTLTGVTGVGTTSFNLALNSSDSRLLDTIQFRVGDRQTGNFRVGTRYPITTGTYTTGSAATSTSLAGITINGVSASSLLNQYLGATSSLTVPQIQYEDLGLTLKTTPVVQKGPAGSPCTSTSKSKRSPAPRSTTSPSSPIGSSSPTSPSAMAKPRS